jgi:hypothetical protein
MKAIVLTCDKYRAMTEHMILQYERLWPEHPFQFRIPYQNFRDKDSDRRQYIKTPHPIKATVLNLLSDLDDEEWVYWCIDDKYPMTLLLDRIKLLLADLDQSADMSGLLFCRCRETLTDPAYALYPQPRVGSSGDAYLERKTWSQIWIHQFLRVKVIRYFFSQIPDSVRVAKEMDALKLGIPKPPELRLFVTERNLSIFGESTSRGLITQNCFDSIVRTNIVLPPWFARSNGVNLTIGEL